MKHKGLFIIGILVIIFFSCEDEKERIETTTPSSQTTIQLDSLSIEESTEKETPLSAHDIILTKDFLYDQYTLEDISMMVINPGEIIGLEKEKILFEKMTNQPIVTMGHYTQKTNRTKIMILEKVEKIYENINPYLFYISIIVVVIFVLINIKKLKEVYEELVILIAIAGLYASRIFIITFTKEMMFEEALNTSYLACIYDIQYLFGIISIIFLVTNIKNRNKNKVNKDESYYRKIFSNLKDWVNRKKGEKI